MHFHYSQFTESRVLFVAWVQKYVTQQEPLLSHSFSVIYSAISTAGASRLGVNT